MVTGRAHIKGHSLSHGPGRAAAERRKVFLLLLHLQHQDQAGILLPQVVQQEDHEVVDDVGLVTLPASVYIDGDAGVLQCNPLEGQKGRLSGARRLKGSS